MVDQTRTSCVIGTLLTVITLFLIELFTRMGVPVPNPAVLYLTAVVYATFTGGMVCGTVSGGLTLLYGWYFFFTAGHPFHYSRDNFARVLVLCLATPLMVAMVAALKRRNDALLARQNRLIDDLREAATQIRSLEGMLPICASCKKIRDDDGSWHQLESYISDHSQARFSHGLCPDCLGKAREELHTSP